MQGEGDHGEVEPPARELGLERGRRPLDDAQGDVWVAIAHDVEQLRDEPATDRADHADADGAHDLGAQGHDVGGGGVDLGEDAARALGDGGPLLGEPSRGPVDERGVDLALEPCDPRRDVGLDGAERECGGGERAPVLDLDERLELSELHGWMLSVFQMTSIMRSNLIDATGAGRMSQVARRRNPPSSFTSDLMEGLLHPPEQSFRLV